MREMFLEEQERVLVRNTESREASKTMEAHMQAAMAAHAETEKMISKAKSVSSKIEEHVLAVANGLRGLVGYNSNRNRQIEEDVTKALQEHLAAQKYSNFFALEKRMCKLRSAKGTDWVEWDGVLECVDPDGNDEVWLISAKHFFHANQVASIPDSFGKTEQFIDGEEKCVDPHTDKRADDIHSRQRDVWGKFKGRKFRFAVGGPSVTLEIKEAAKDVGALCGFIEGQEYTFV